MQEDTISDTSTAGLDVSTAHPPAPGADVQKPIPPEGEAPPEVVAETTEQQEARKQSKFQRRLDRHKARAVAAETESKILRERLEKLEAQPKPSQETGEPKREDFPGDYEAYLRALMKFDAKQDRESTAKAEREAKEGKEKQQAATVGSEKVAKDWSEREKSFQAANKDYEEVVGEFLESDEFKSIHPNARVAIVESEVGPAVLHYLAKNTDEADRIAELSPTRQIAELGKLEAKVSMPAKKTTSAPAPATTTSGGRTATKDLSKMSQDEYEAHRKSLGARWAR